MLLEPVVQLDIARHIVMDSNMEAVAMAEGIYRGLPIQHIAIGLPIQHIAISQDLLLVMT